MIRLAARTLRRRAGAFLAAFVTMLLGSAMIMACGGLMETGVRTDMAPGRLANADIVVSGGQNFDVPQMGYTAVVPERVRIDAGLARSIGALPGVAGATGHIFDAPAPAGKVDAISIVAKPGVSLDRLRERVDAEVPKGVVTYVGDQRGLAERPQAADSSDSLVSLGAVFGAMALIVSLFGVASMLVLSVQQRQRELALLRAVGSTPKQLRTLILGETLILAVTATAVAILPGRWLGEIVLRGLINSGVVTEGVQFRLGWIPALIGISSAVLAALGGAFVASRRAAKTRPTQALAAAGLPERRPVSVGTVLVGLVLVGGGITLALVTMTSLHGVNASSTGMPAAIILAIGLATLSPLLARPLVALLRWPLRAVTGQSGRLAMLNAKAAIDRTAAVVAPIVILTGTATGMLYMQSTDQHAARSTFASSLTPDVVVTAKHGVTPELREQISATPGVSGVSDYVDSTGFLEQPPGQSYRWANLILRGVTPQNIGSVTPIKIRDGNIDALRGRSAALNIAEAKELGTRVGDSMALRMGDNRSLTVKIVALYATEKDEDDTVVLPADVLAKYTTSGRVNTLLVAADSNHRSGELIDDLKRRAGTRDGVTVSGREALTSGFNETQSTQSFATYLIIGMILAYTAISVVNALASSTAARRREFGLQRLTGSTRGQVLRMLSVESLLVALIGLLLGTASAAVTTIAFSRGRADDPYPSGPPTIYAAVVALAVLLPLVSTLLPGWWATRKRPIDAAVIG